MSEKMKYELHHFSELYGTRNDWEANDSYWSNVKIPDRLTKRKKIGTEGIVHVISIAVCKHDFQCKLRQSDIL